MQNIPPLPLTVKNVTVNVKPTLLWVKNRGYTRRYLLSGVDEDPYAGHPAFDYMVAHGFGSGDLTSLVPVEYRGLSVKITPVLKAKPEHYDMALAYIAERVKQVRDGYYAYYTQDGQTFYEVTPAEKGSDIFQVPELDWYNYTILGGTRQLAYDHLRTFNRRHVWFKDAIQQDTLLKQYANLVDIM